MRHQPRGCKGTPAALVTTETGWGHGQGALPAGTPPAQSLTSLGERGPVFCTPIYLQLSQVQVRANSDFSGTLCVTCARGWVLEAALPSWPLPAPSPLTPTPRGCTISGAGVEAAVPSVWWDFAPEGDPGTPRAVKSWPCGEGEPCAPAAWGELLGAEMGCCVHGAGGPPHSGWHPFS